MGADRPLSHLSVVRAPARELSSLSFPVKGLLCHRLVLQPGMNVSLFLPGSHHLKKLKSVLLQGAFPDLIPLTPPWDSSSLTHSLRTTFRLHTHLSSKRCTLTEGGLG